MGENGSRGDEPLVGPCDASGSIWSGNEAENQMRFLRPGMVLR
jgi:hypothetical protein